MVVGVSELRNILQIEKSPHVSARCGPVVLATHIGTDPPHCGCQRTDGVGAGQGAHMSIWNL